MNVAASDEVIGRGLVAAPLFALAGILTGRTLLGAIFCVAMASIVTALLWQGDRRARAQAPDPEPYDWTEDS